MAEIETLSYPEEYTDRNGETQTRWNEVGIIITKDNGKKSFKLHHVPGKFGGVFPQKRRDNSGGNSRRNSTRNEGGNEPW